MRCWALRDWRVQEGKTLLTTVCVFWGELLRSFEWGSSMFKSVDREECERIEFAGNVGKGEYIKNK